MKRKFLQAFKVALPNRCPIRVQKFEDVNVASDGDVYFAIGEIIAKLAPELQKWFNKNCLIGAPLYDEIDEKLTDIFCEKYNIEF